MSHLSLVFHLLGIVFWMGSLLILTRAMVLHTRETPVVRQAFSLLEKKIDLFSWIGMLIVIVTGLYQLIALWPEGGFRHARWMHHKLTVVIVLVVLQVLLTRKRISWQRDPNAPLSKTLPVVVHSALGVLLIGILCLVYFGQPHFLHNG